MAGRRRREGMRVITRIAGKVSELKMPDEPVRQKITSMLAGTTVGTIVVGLLPLNGLAVGAFLLFGSVLLSALFRQKAGLVGLGVAMLLWMQVFAPRFAIDGPMPAGT